MDFSHSDKVRGLQESLQSFMDEHVYPAEPRFDEAIEAKSDQPHCDERQYPRAELLIQQPLQGAAQVSRVVGIQAKARLA